MGGVNRGKQFEAAIKEALKEVYNGYLMRLIDPSAGFAGVKNICDFIFFKAPTMYLLECKTLQGNTLNFKTAISTNQWDGLLEASATPGVIAGVVVWFQDWDTTVFVDIRELERMRKLGIKSLNIKDIRHKAVKFAVVPGIRKKILFRYNGLAMISSINEMWEGDYENKEYKS